MSFLPGAARAQVEPAKVRDDLLNASHPKNGGKAGFFKAFGFAEGDWMKLLQALRAHPATNRVAGTTISSHGVKHVVRCRLGKPDNRDPCITTVWIEETGRVPRLVTAYP